MPNVGLLTRFKVGTHHFRTLLIDDGRIEQRQHKPTGRGLRRETIQYKILSQEWNLFLLRNQLRIQETSPQSGYAKFLNNGYSTC